MRGSRILHHLPDLVPSVVLVMPNSRAELAEGEARVNQECLENFNKIGWFTERFKRKRSALFTCHGCPAFSSVLQDASDSGNHLLKLWRRCEPRLLWRMHGTHG